MTPRILTADEARLLQGIESREDLSEKTRWPTWSDCVYDLAATVVAQAAEIERLRAEVASWRARPDGVHVSQMLDIANATVVDLRAIIDGRTTPPTGEEIEAHYRAGGTWYVASTHGRALTTTKGDAIALCGHLAANRYPATWWAIDTRRRPCAWPVVAEASR